MENIKTKRRVDKYIKCIFKREFFKAYTWEILLILTQKEGI